MIEIDGDMHTIPQVSLAKIRPRTRNSAPFFVSVCHIQYTFVIVQETPTGWRSEDQEQSFCPALGTRWRN